MGCLVVLAAAGWADLGARGSGALARQTVKKRTAGHRSKPGPGLADLVVRSVRAAPGSVVVGGEVSIVDVVANVGRKLAPKTTERYYVSSSAKLILAITRSTPQTAAFAGRRLASTRGLGARSVVYRVLLAQRSVPKLRAGQTAAATTRVVVSSTVRSGSYYVIACANAVHPARESNTKNDCRTARSRLTVKPVAQGSSTGGGGGGGGAGGGGGGSGTGGGGGGGGTGGGGITGGGGGSTGGGGGSTGGGGGRTGGGGGGGTGGIGPYHAPVLSTSASTTVLGATEFLYTGSDPVQSGVAPGRITAQRVDAIRGEVLDENDQPLPGATVTILDHPEFGQTTSQSDGSYTIDVNGGGPLTVTIAMAGRVTVQRVVQPRWQDWTVVDDVVLRPIDSRSNAIDLTSSAPFQVARGNPVTDASGTRQATLLFPSGTTGSMVMPDGSQRPLTKFHVHLTEVTVGNTGLESMPADLPPTNDYTYAIDYTVDEAQAAGATSVRFSQPLVSYTEDFLGIPTGTVVPSGSYEDSAGHWLPEANGDIIKILSITNGLSNVDTTGAGTADDTGISDAERKELATLYSAGTQLTRVPIDHFSVADYNFGGFPKGSIAPDAPSPGAPPTPCAEPTKPGSIIGCDSQSLGESLAIPGSEFSLDYSSAIQPGQTSAYTVKIPLTPADTSTIPSGDLQLWAIPEVSIGGRILTGPHYSGPDPDPLFRYSIGYPLTKNMGQETAIITWDGTDAFGRTMVGTQRAEARLCYQYQRPYDLLEGQSSTGSGGGGGAGGWGAAAPDGSVEFHTTRDFATTCSAWVDRTLGTDDTSEGLGGWRLSGPQPYDMGLGAQAGGGQALTGSSSTATLHLLSGGTDLSGSQSSPDGTSLSQARFAAIRAMTVGPDGTIFIAETSNPDGTNETFSQIREIGPDGKLETIAGGLVGFSGDGGPAKDARFGGEIGGLALGADGSLYVSDTTNQRVRRIDSKGIITTVAGGAPDSRGSGVIGNYDGLPATEAYLGDPTSLAVADDGTLYIADSESNSVVYRVDPGGIIERYAGTGQRANSGDGGPARDAAMVDAVKLALAPDGSLYIGDVTCTIRKVDPLGTISTVIPASLCLVSGGTGGPASEATLDGLGAMAFAPDGTLYISETSETSDTGRIRAVLPDGTITQVAGIDTPIMNGESFPENAPAPISKVPITTGLAVQPDGSLLFAGGLPGSLIGEVRPVLPGATTTQFSVASPDGESLITYDGDGRPATVHDTLTGATTATYSYDAQGRLQTVTTDAGTLTVMRDSNGNPTGMVAPTGYTTQLTTDAQGHLASLTDPSSGQTTKLTTTDDGMLTEVDVPDGKHTFTYGDGGYLTKDTGPDGRTVTLSRSETSNTRTVAVSVDGSAATSYKISWTPDDQVTREIDAPGEKPSVEIDSGNTVQTTTPDGVVTAVSSGPDPRFGMQAPVPVSVTITEPGGRVTSYSEARSVALSDSSNPLSVTSATDVQTLDGASTTDDYDGATKTFTLTTPAGRIQKMSVDAVGRPILFTPDPSVTSVAISYDAHGNLSSLAQGTLEDDLTYDGEGRKLTMKDGAGHTASYRYADAQGTTTMTDPSGATWGKQFDGSGNLAGVTLPLGGQFAVTVDRFGNLSSLVSPGSRPLTIARGPFDRPTSYTAPSGVVESYSRDAADRLTGSTSSLGTVTALSYDSLGRLTTASRTDTGAGAAGESFTWDGLVPATQSFTGPDTGAYTYTNNQLGQVTSLKLDDGPSLSRTYDPDGLLTQDGDFRLDRSGPGGAATQITGDGLGIANTFTKLGQLATRTMTVNGAVVAQSTYTYNPATGQLSGRTDSAGSSSVTTQYTYDANGQLKGATRSDGTADTYTYDGDGNRAKSSGAAQSAVAYTYDAADRLTSAGNLSYAEDGDGNVIARGNDRFTYGTHHELLSARLGDGSTISYRYDQSLRLVARTDQSGTTQYLYGDPGQPWEMTASRAPDGTLTTYSYDDNERLISILRGGARYFIATDQVGTPYLITDSSGKVMSSIVRDPFGRVLSQDESFELAIGFGGGIEDPATHLVRMGYREYDPSAGRWLSRDPVAFQGGDLNLYRYAGNDPTNEWDPSGLVGIDVSLCVGVCLGVKVNFTRQGWSTCMETGIGYGADVAVPTGLDGEPDATGLSVTAKAKVAVGSFASVAIEASHGLGLLGGCSKAGYQANLFGASAGLELDQNGDLNGNLQGDPGDKLDESLRLADDFYEAAGERFQPKSGSLTAQIKATARLCVGQTW